MLRSRDIELIAGLVQGTLDDESDARALIAGSDEARAEYEAQKLAFETLSSFPPARLSEHERSALRRDLWTALQSDPQPEPGRARWYYRWVSVAAGLFLMVGLVAVLTQGGAQQDAATADSFAEIADGLSSETTPAATDTPEPAEEDRMETQGADDTDTAGAAAPLAGSPAEFFEEIADQVRSGSLDESTTLTRDGADADSPDPLSCVETAGLADHDIVAEVADFQSSDEPMRYLVAVPSGEEPGPETPVSFVSVAGCEIVYVDG